MVDNTETNNMDMYQKQKNKEEMKMQVISFALMIGLTIIAFAIVAFGEISKMFVVPTLLLMALIQVGFQFYYFMHLKDKGHAMPAVLMYGGAWAATLTLAGLILVVWW